MQFGEVITNDQGRLVAAESGYLDCALDPKLAEAMAFKEALAWLRS